MRPQRTFRLGGLYNQFLKPKNIELEKHKQRALI